MHRDKESDNYSVTLGHDEMIAPGIEYYIQAADFAGNTLLHGYSFSPLTVSVITGTQDLAVNDTSNALVLDKAEPNKKKTKIWLWIGLGVLIVGAVAAVATSEEVNVCPVIELCPTQSVREITLTAK